MSIDWSHTLVEAAITVLPTTSSLLLYLWKRGEVAKEEQEKRHKENRQSIQDIAATVSKIQIAEEYMPQHFHQEHYTGAPSDPLTVEGIIKKPDNGRRK